MPLLEVEGLVKYYGRRAVVNGVSFNVDAGEIVGLLGPNGAGKTTSFRMATGQITPNDGKVTFNGEDVTSLPMYQRARRGMGYLSQEPSVFRKLSVEGNLIAILEALPRSRKLGRKLTRTERWDRTNEALKRFKLDVVRKNTAGRCSGGEKRRLEIARCLVCEPLLILLDEPFAAVDPKTTEDIRANIRELADAGIGILITDHNVREVFRTADRVYLITAGKVVTRGTPMELVNDQIAIDAYLGRSFEEDGFTRHFDARGKVSGPGPVASPSPVFSAPRSWASPAPAAQPAAPEPALQAPPVTPAPAFPSAPPSPFGTGTPPPAAAPAGGSMSAVLEQEKVRRAVEGLADARTVQASMLELASRGLVAVSSLLDAMERRDATLRRRAFEMLGFVAKEYAPFDYDPDAPAEVRLRQVAYLRARLERRR
ncbi:LPS export ABC transporter ATP-binding protein [Frigoriglobus tundricola]|uniref:Lipopolysaccharide ABC transporter, ATP-binding protein LptB n=1 Tax=Frigoriglobus tundricola TaxID=2774151 RepID=A0A6M5YUF5_9BACT|nr:LPS export ABC transporter ATP-binding protein [Frigoriglobus tundricola]QJW97010.1 Lipopolysaccharide ABC transporter, ATP-binding protein LptB [Frigoriglobus tundricola]